MTAWDFGTMPFCGRITFAAVKDNRRIVSRPGLKLENYRGDNEEPAEAYEKPGTQLQALPGWVANVEHGDEAGNEDKLQF